MSHTPGSRGGLKISWYGWPAARQTQRPGHPADDLVRGDVDQDGDPDARVARREGLVERPRLHVGPGEAVEDHAAVGVGPAQPVEQQADGDLVGHELARVHVAPGLDAERRPVADGGPEQVAGGHDRDPEPLGKERRLRPLPGPGAPRRMTTCMASRSAPP